MPFDEPSWAGLCRRHLDKCDFVSGPQLEAVWQVSLAVDRWAESQKWKVQLSMNLKGIQLKFYAAFDKVSCSND